MKLIKGNKVINATKKAYEVVYKHLGYKIYNNEKNDLTEQPNNEDKEGINTIGIDNITKAEIIEKLTEKGIEHNPRDKKEVLYRLMIEGD
ncbi:MAG: hypothetical protein GX375_10205 [Clostridiales bacterium]|nr:hypothetical protein [Clostridiales bacterium]